MKHIALQLGGLSSREIGAALENLSRTDFDDVYADVVTRLDGRSAAPSSVGHSFAAQLDENAFLVLAQAMVSIVLDRSSDAPISEFDDDRGYGFGV